MAHPASDALTLRSQILEEPFFPLLCRWYDSPLMETSTQMQTDAKSGNGRACPLPSLHFLQEERRGTGAGMEGGFDVGSCRSGWFILLSWPEDLGAPAGLLLALLLVKLTPLVPYPDPSHLFAASGVVCS